MNLAPFHQLASAIWFLVVGLAALIFSGSAFEDFHRRRWTPFVVHSVIAIAILLVLAAAAYGQAPPPSAPPRRLVVWSDLSCANAREFWEDVDAGLGQELAAAGWTIERWEIRQRPLQAWALGIRGVPCFVLPAEGIWWYGYRPAEFREALDLDPRPPTSSPEPPPAEPFAVTEHQIQDWLAEQLAEQRIQLEFQLRQTMEADQARQAALEEALADQRRTLDELRQADPDPTLAARLDQISARLDALARPRPAIHREPEPAPAQAAPADPSGADPPTDDQPSASPGARLIRLGRFALTIGEAAGLFGVSTFGTFGALQAGVMVWRLIRRRRNPSPSSSSPAHPSPPSPPAKCPTCAQLREQVAHLEVQLEDLRSRPLRVDDSVERFHRAMQMVANAHPGDQSFARWRKQVLEHFRLITSGDGVSSHAN